MQISNYQKYQNTNSNYGWKIILMRVGNGLIQVIDKARNVSLVGGVRG